MPIFRNCAMLLMIVAAPAIHADDRADILIADFEANDYRDWKAEGEAFGTGPARGTLPNQMHVTGYLGKGLVNSYRGGDATTGTLTSPAIKIERKYIRFLIGGGKDPEKLAIQLLLDGKIVRNTTGPNDKPGGSEKLDWHQWDVGELEGKSVAIQIVDKATGGWGHINIDHILQTDKKLPGLVENPRKSFTVEKRYLHLPVKNGAAKRRVGLRVDEKTVREFEIELADSQADFWVFLDLHPFHGKRAVVAIDKLYEDSKALELIAQADEIQGAKELYREPLRPRFHFTSRRGWLNDPNGLVFHNGNYHLFYQHNPYGWPWGNMHWGHATSKDLVRWEEQPIAIYPAKFGDWAFSGSAVVDRDNTAGFNKDNAAAIVAAYTSTGRGECIAYSLDNGKTFVEYEGNPVVKHQGRDPKLIWHALTKRWVMAVYDEQGKSEGIAFYTSPDLKKWERQSRIDGWFECPEIFELPIEGTKEKRWIVYAANNEYAIGTFDGKEFKQESGKHKGNFGNCFYAAQTYNNIPEADGRRIQIGWLRIDLPGMPFNQMMSFPTELTLRKTEDGLRMFANPVREIEKLHARKHEWKDLKIRNGLLDQEVKVEDVHVRAEFELGHAKEVSILVRDTLISYNVDKQLLQCRKIVAPLKPLDGKIRFDILVDRASVEIFANDGRVYMPIGVIHMDRDLGLFVKGDGAKATRLEVFDLKSSWDR